MTSVCWDGFAGQPRDLRSLIVLEEEEKEEDYGSWAKQPTEDEPLLSDLSGAEADLIRGFDTRARRYSKRAGRYRGIHLFLGILSIAAAAGVSVTIALGAPSWVAAILGAVAAVAQGVLQFTHVELLAF